MAVDMNEMVLVENPDLPKGPHNPREMLRSALEDVWRDKGWKLAKTTKGDN